MCLLHLFVESDPRGGKKRGVSAHLHASIILPYTPSVHLVSIDGALDAYLKTLTCQNYHFSPHPSPLLYLKNTAGITRNAGPFQTYHESLWMVDIMMLNNPWLGPCLIWSIHIHRKSISSKTSLHCLPWHQPQAQRLPSQIRGSCTNDSTLNRISRFETKDIYIYIYHTKWHGSSDTSTTRLNSRKLNVQTYAVANQHKPQSKKTTGTNTS